MQIGWEDGRSEETGTPPVPTPVSGGNGELASPPLGNTQAENFHLMRNSEIFAIQANQVDQIATAVKCQIEIFPVGMTSFYLCQAAHLSLPGSQHVNSSGRKTLGGLPRVPFCRAHSQYRYPKWR